MSIMQTWNFDVLIIPACHCEEHSSEAISLEGVGLPCSQLQCGVINHCDGNIMVKKFG